ncbi:MAG TPA: GNAT family N-acetyltransferase [Roseiarcus sp.]|nr:GNAT family N-acetyltransferase [Roseiarcus sp.]
MTIALRRMSLDDVDRVAFIHRTSFDERLPWLAGRYTPAEDRRFFKDRVFASCEVWGAIDRKPIGFIAFRPGWIDQLYVLPDRQRQGVGGALLDVAKAASPSLRLWTFQRNAAARRFYEGQGFVAATLTDGGNNDEREPDILYRWDRL